MLSRTRGYLPHLETPNGTYFVTFRLDDSLPRELLNRWKQELEYNTRCNPPDLRKDFEREYRSKVESFLDTGAGQCWLKESRIASIVDRALRYFNTQRYFLHTWTIMPNHVHVLFTLRDSFRLSQILQSWKGFTAHCANHELNRSGSFWQREYFDRLIQSERHFEFAIRYVLNNPVKAGLCQEIFQWSWTGCSAEVQDRMKRFYL